MIVLFPGSQKLAKSKCFIHKNVFCFGFFSPLLSLKPKSCKLLCIHIHIHMHIHIHIYTPDIRIRILQLLITSLLQLNFLF